MADDTTLGAAVGTGDKISTDDLGAGTKVQRVKVQFGADGSATDTSSANPMPVVQTGTPGLPTGASTAAKQPALGTAGTPSTDVLSVQGVTSMTALKVDGSAVTQPVSDGGGSLTVDGSLTVTGPLTDTQLRATAVPVSDGAGSLTVDNGGTFAVQIAANSSVNVAQVAGTTTDTNSGTKSAGTQRVVLATDQPQLTNALKVDGSAVTQPISATNLSTNMAQVAGTTTSVNSGAKDAGTQRVILASDQTVIPVSDNSGSLTVDAPVGTPIFSTPTPSTTGGWSKITALAQTTTKKAVKASAGTLGGYYAYNPNASVAYIQVFDVASGSVTLGSTAPDLVFGIPAGSAANLEFTNGVNMATAITLACTTTATGSTAPSTGLDLTIVYK